MHRTMKLSNLLAMTAEPLYCAYKRMTLRAQIRKEWMYSEYFEAQAKNARKGQADVQKRLIRLEAELRDFGG